MKISWRGATGTALTLFLLWWAFRDAHWGEVWAAIRNADQGQVLVAIVLGTIIFPLRAFRWRPILDPVAPNLPYGELWRATAIGSMANNILPARIGELVRAFMLTRTTGVPFAATFASLVVDRVFDSVIVVLLLVISTLDPKFPGGDSALRYAGAAVLLILGLGLALYAIVFFPDRLIRLYELFARRVAPRFEERGRRLLRSFADGLSVLRHPGRFAVVFGWALALWLAQALSFWVMFEALGIELPFSAALFIQGLIVVGVAIPSTPGYFGPFEAAAIAGLSIYGVDRSLAGAWALSYHILSLIPITVIGLYYLARSGMRLAELNELKR